MNDPRDVAKTAFELARAIFIDTSSSSVERRNHLQTCGHTINQLCDEIARLTPAPSHDVDQYYPKDMTPEEAATILLDAERTKDEEVCQECGVYQADHKGTCEGCLAYREHTAT